MASKIKALQQWCRKMAEGYPGVEISNFTTAWRDGLAFCAIIHRFRPDLIDFESLSSENVFENCKMAFEIAEKELSIPAFLEAEDMVRLKVPDKLSIITYVSQYYNWLHALPQLGGPGVKSKVSGKTISGVKRPTDSDTTQAPITKKATTVEAKENAAPAKAAAASGADKCGICHEHVYLIERHMEDGKLFHRSCFRRSELSPANKVLTRSPFMSPSLSSETPKLTATNADNKYSIFSEADRDDKVTNLQRHMDIHPVKTESDIKVSRKLDFAAGSKHPIDGPGREDTKKSKMQPKTVFDDEKSKKIPAEKDKSVEYTSQKNSESNRFLPLSSKEAHKLEKRQEGNVTSEKTLKEKPDNTKVNKSVFLQQKSKATQEIPTPSVASVPANSKLETKSDSVAVTSRVPALSVQPHSDSAQSKSKQTIGNAIQKLMEEDKLSFDREKKSSESVQSENKHTVGKDSQKLSEDANKFTVGKSIQKPSEKNQVDAIPSKSNLLPDVHNLQKMFSGKPSSDSSESVIPVYPKAKPRTSLIEDQEPSKDAVAAKPDVNESSAPKPVPRKNVLGSSDIMSAPKQLEISSQVKKSTLEKESGDKSTASKPLAPGVSLSVSKNDPQFSMSATSSPFDKNDKASLAERKLTETKVSVTVQNADGPKNVILTNQSHSLDKKIDANKIVTQNNMDVKSTDKSGHASVLNFSNVKKQTEAGSVGKTGTKTNQQLSIDKEQTPLSIASTRKDNTRLITAKLSTTTQDSTVRTTLTPAKLQPSMTLSQVQNENKFISSRNPVVVTVNSTLTSHTGPSVSQTETAHISAGVSNSTFMTSRNGIKLTKNAEKSLATQVSKDSTISAKTDASTPRVQTSNKMQEALSVFSSGKPMSGEIGITFTNNINKSDVNVTKLQKVNNSSSNAALSHSKDIHNKAKATSDVLSQNINQNSQAKPASSNLLNLRDSEQKSAAKTDKADSKQTDTHGVKSLSSVKNSAISGSKEDILDINNVRLKRVMPGQKDNQNGQKTNIYDVKLKKVDAIKGDTKWDSTPQKPSRAIDVSETSQELKTANSHIISNDDMKGGLSASKGIDPKASVLSSVVSNPHTTTSQKSISEMPQWKKDAEERQKKLSANVVNSEPKTDNVKYLKQISDNGTPLKSGSTVGLSSNGKAAKIENVSVGGPSLLKTASETVATQKNGNKMLPAAENTGGVKKLDWQLEAEKRMAAIANFDKGIVGKLKETDNGIVGKLKATDNGIVGKLKETDNGMVGKLKETDNGMVGKLKETDNGMVGKLKETDNGMVGKLKETDNGMVGKLKETDNGMVGKLKETDKSNTTSADKAGSQQAKKIVELHTSDVSKDGGKNNDNVKLNGETITGKYSVPKDKTTTGLLEKSVAKSKETELKITVNKMKLTSVQEISTLPDKEIEQSSNKNGETEDFRQVLHQLKHVTTEDSGKIDVVKPDSQTLLHPEQTKHDILTTTANRAIPNNTMNKNNNNKQNKSEKSHVSDMDSTKVFNKNSDLAVKTPALDHLADENGNVRKDNMFKVPEKKHNLEKVSSVAEKKDTSHTSPKGKKKISVQDTKVSETPTPSAPTHKKKIQVTSQFDFDKSSDFEQSLILSTAKLTIQGDDTPEKLMSSSSSQEALSPQISAIELQQQLHNIDTRLSELELKGRELEDSIRKVIGLDEDDDELMIEWFTLINKKNELVRKEADLIYLSKEQELEDEQEQIESQLLYLMTKPDECKSPEEKQEEDYLINRKIALVEQRNKIVDSMDEDRIRYEAEDKNIEVTLKDKGYWKDSTGTLKALKGKKVANSMFYT
ncbi:hypothetical protein BsWGS_06544 [Bradybaena similaris]